VKRQCQPSGHAESNVHGRHQLLHRAAEIRLDSGDGLEVAGIDQACAGRVSFDELLRVSDHIKELGAVLDGPEVAGGGDDLRGDYHDDAEGDD
jgi:hypothetical protein